MGEPKLQKKSLTTQQSSIKDNKTETIDKLTNCYILMREIQKKGFVMMDYLI